MQLWEMQLSFWQCQKVNIFSVFFNKWVCIKAVGHHTLHVLLWPYLPSHMQSLRLHGPHQLEIVCLQTNGIMGNFENYKYMIWIDREMQKDIRNSGKIVRRMKDKHWHEFIRKMRFLIIFSWEKLKFNCFSKVSASLRGSILWGIWCRSFWSTCQVWDSKSDLAQSRSSWSKSCPSRHFHAFPQRTWRPC